MNKPQKNFFICIAIMIVVVIVILVILAYLNKLLKSEEDEYEYYPIEEIEAGSELEQVSVRNSFYVVKNCINKFYTNYNLIYNNNSEKEEYIQAVYNMLDQDYIEYKNITLDNLETKLPAIKSEKTINITDMYVSEINQNVAIYLTNGKLKDISTSELVEFSMMLKVDMTNETYKIFLEDYLEEKYAEIKVGDTIQINCEDEIKNDIYNTFEFEEISDATYITDIFNTFKEDIMNDRTKVYKNLDNEYRTKRFETQEIFDDYVKNNMKNISLMKLSKYQKTEYEDYIQYTCIDDYGNYYIFNETSVMKFSIILDTYTVDIPRFIEKYNQSNDKTKVALNINKFITGINDGNYNYSYSILAESFKQNKYQNIEIFKQYIKQNLFDKNKVEFKEFSQQGSNYIYKIKISNEDGTEKKDMTIIMKLYEGTKFEMSFNIE